MRRALVVVAVVAAAALTLWLTGGASSVTERIDAWRQRPRVLLGADTFETVTVTEGAMAPQTGPFDNEPGEDLALVDFNGIRILLPTTLGERQRLEFTGDVRSRWSDSSRLARIGGALVVVETGNGLDTPRVHD